MDKIISLYDLGRANKDGRFHMIEYRTESLKDISKDQILSPNSFFFRKSNL